MIPFNKPYLTGKETHYIYEAVHSGKIAGNGNFTKRCQQFFKDRYNFKECLLTTSCTDALEMCALLLNIEAGDEIIMPAYTFVSTANAFVLRGAKIIFADSSDKNPNIDTDQIESLITSKTKAIVLIHYAGISCDMERILEICEKHKLFLVEDAAQAIDSYYKGKPLGGIGHLSTFSFHETKNIISGEGGMLVINDEDFIQRAEIIWEKGTNRSSFFRGEVNKYGWMDLGSSFLPSEITAAFLYAQLENLEKIQQRRVDIWNLYFNGLKEVSSIKLPSLPDYATNNGHIFYIICESINIRTKLISYLKSQKIHSVFHYLSLEKSPYYKNKSDDRVLIHSNNYEECLLRLPLFYELTNEQVIYITNHIIEFFKSNS